MRMWRRIDAQKALSRTMKNTHRLWQPKPNDQNSAATRYSLDQYFPIQHTPKWTITPTDTVFTLGSCFARNIEHKLHSMKFTVLTHDFTLPGNVYKGADEETRAHRGALNKYNVHSMQTEVLRALGKMPAIQDNGLIQLPGGEWMDPQASNVAPASHEATTEIRRLITDVTGRIRSADIVFITLGLTETWYDNVTGLSLNQPPSPMAIRAMKGRFSFSNTTASQGIKMLEETIEAIKEVSTSKNVRIVVTVSPVPLGTTYTGWDVVVANTYSKSTLRTIAQQVAEKYGYVDYFPSFEIVTNSPRHLAWMEDGAHVRNEMVGFVMDSFVSCYLEKATPSALQA